MKKFFLTAGSRLFSGLRLALGALVFAPLLLLVVYVNYTVDNQGYYKGDAFMRAIASELLAGNDIAGYNQLTERQRDVIKVMVANMEPGNVPETIALGSSRIMQLTQAMVGTSFFNSSTTGGDFYDVLGMFYLYDKADKLPKNVIIGLDPWLFNADPEWQDDRSDRALYAEFLTERLGVSNEDTEGYEKTDETKKWQYLFDLTYFQGNVEYAVAGADEGELQPEVVTGNVYDQATEVKRADGSLLYDKAYRTRPQEAVNADALYQTSVFFRVEDYDEPDRERVAIFEKWLVYMQERGINVIILFTPYPPIVYDNAVANADKYGGFLATEPLVHRLAKKYNIPVYGSYNPYAIPATEKDFFDGLHPRGVCIERSFPGVPQALAARDAGALPEVDYRAKAPDTDEES